MWWIFGVLCCGLPGCGESEPTATEAHLRQLATVYLNYTVATGSPPATEQALVKHIANLAPFVAAERPECRNCQSLPFRSERDGSPFVVCYGQGICFSSEQSAPVIAYEKQGADGTRYVAYANGKIQRLSDDEAQRLIDEL